MEAEVEAVEGRLEEAEAKEKLTAVPSLGRRSSKESQKPPKALCKS